MANKVGRVSLHDASIALYTYGKHTKNAPIPSFEFDLMEFRDPMPHFKETTGADPKVQEWLRDDKKVLAIIHQCRLLADEYISIGHGGWLSIGFRDYHEKWISRGVAELVANSLAPDYPVAVVYGL